MAQIPSDLFGLQQMVAASLWGSAPMQIPFIAQPRPTLNLPEFYHALQCEALGRYRKFLQGYIRYKEIQEQPSRRSAPIVHQIGQVTLQDYGALYGASPQAKPVLVVPSLINQPYIFDLCPGFSLFEHMVQNQLRPYLINWGGAGEGAEDHHFESYLQSFIPPFVKKIQTLTSYSPLSLIGYCIGGLLALAAAQEGDHFDRVTLLATPWDFHAGTSSTQRQLLLEIIEQELELRGHLSSFCLQLIFHLIHPMAALRKFVMFADLPEGTLSYQRFIAVEQWVNDTVPLTRKVAGEIFGTWYQENPFAHSQQIFGKPLNREIPTLMIMAEQDRIVPLPCASALSALLPQAQSLTVPLGHVGLLVSERAKDLVWQPLVDWLK